MATFHKRNDEGWFIWWVELGTINAGLDLTSWGLGFVLHLRHRIQFSVTFGPFYAFSF